MNTTAQEAKSFSAYLFMQYFVMILEIIGTVAFALSGSATALEKSMDIFGVCVMGVTTAVGGGIIRDLVLGMTPPQALKNPVYVIIAVIVSIIIFFPTVRRFFMSKKKYYEMMLLITDSLGLGIFTVYGVRAAIEAGYAQNTFLTIFVAVVTGVGGGVMRDIFAGNRPYIFVRHIYASAAIVGALVCKLLWNTAGQNISMILGLVLIFVIRLCSAKYHLSLPKATDIKK